MSHFTEKKAATFQEVDINPNMWAWPCCLAHHAIEHYTIANKNGGNSKRSPFMNAGNYEYVLESVLKNSTSKSSKSSYELIFKKSGWKKTSRPEGAWIWMDNSLPLLNVW